MIVLAYLFSGLSLLMSSVYLIKLTFPNAIFPIKLLAMVLSPYWAILGALGVVLGWLYQAPAAIFMGIIGVGWMSFYIWRNTREHHGFERAFGADWSDRIKPEQAEHMVHKRWTLALNLNSDPEPVWERDVAFWTISDTGRELLCDIWRPGTGKGSGLAFIYLHGSGWWVGEKDYLKTTRLFFRHLATQGHTVMDVDYRLCPEVDLYGMVGDAKRAVAWIKANASRYGIDPEKVVLAGGSAGAHIALLAGYTPDHPGLTPKELKGADLSVCGLVSYYGSIDLVEGYHRYTTLQLEKNPPNVEIGMDIPFEEKIAHLGRLDVLLGGSPEDVPDMYQMACPITHVRSGSPPTLLFQGTRDVLVPLEPTRALYRKLVDCGVPAVNVVFPWTEHGFDLVLPQTSPPAQSALHDVDRFLALLQNN